MVRTNVAGRLKEGTYRFQVTSVPEEKHLDSGFIKWFWEFTTDSGKLKISFFENEMKDLLAALGAEEVDQDIFEWEPSEMLLKEFQAELFYETGKKDGKQYSKLRGFQAVAPASPADVKWEE